LRLFHYYFTWRSFSINLLWKYVGTCKNCGFFWVRPYTEKSLISLKSTHYNGNMIKVNDKDGTSVLIGLVCIWRIKDTVKVTYHKTSNNISFIK